MTKLLSALVAAVFAVASLSAFAQTSTTTTGKGEAMSAEKKSEKSKGDEKKAEKSKADDKKAGTK